MKWLTQWAITSSVLILILLAVRFMCKGRLSARMKYALWGVVLLRLLVPFQFALPAPVSDALPALASNAVPEVGQWEERSIPVFPEHSKPVAEFDLDLETMLEPGEIMPYKNGTGGQQRSTDGETITQYRYILSPEQIALALWLAGAGLTGTTILLSNLRFAFRLKRRCKQLENADAPIPVYVAEGLPSPCLFGLFRPAIYVTPKAAESPDALRHVLAHELTHYAHKDHIWTFLRCLALVLHWYNPLVWLAAALSKQDGELACDEGTVARLGEAERIPYGHTLVDMAAARSLRPGDLLSCSTAMSGDGRSIRQRVERLVQKPETVKTTVFAAVAALVLAAVFVFAGRPEDKPIDYNFFLEEVNNAQAMSIGEPLISSAWNPGEISDPQSLAQAKQLLTQGRPLVKLEDGSWQAISLSSNSKDLFSISPAEIEQLLFLSSRPLNLFPTSDQDLETADRYWLVPYDACVLLVQWDTELEENAIQPLGYYEQDIISPLKEVARNNRRQTTASDFDLTQYNRDLDAAQGIYRTGNMLSSGQAITDPALLEQAKQLLTVQTIAVPLGTAVLPDNGGPSSKSFAGLVRDNRFCSLSFSPQFPGPDWTWDNWAEHGFYTLVAPDENSDADGFYICSGDWTEGSCLGIIPFEAVDQLTALFDQQYALTASTLYNTFLDRVEGAVSIQIEEGDAQHPDELPPISDPEWLETARAALLTVDPVAEPSFVGGPMRRNEEDLRQEVGDGIYAVTLTSETGEAVSYYIERIPSLNIEYVLTPLEDFPAADRQESKIFDRIGVLHGEANYALWLASKVSSGILPSPGHLARPDLSGLTIHR